MVHSGWLTQRYLNLQIVSLLTGFSSVTACRGWLEVGGANACV